jgi:hypothetical protein
MGLPFEIESLKLSQNLIVAAHLWLTSQILLNSSCSTTSLLKDARATASMSKQTTHDELKKSSPKITRASSVDKVLA